MGDALVEPCGSELTTTEALKEEMIFNFSSKVFFYLLFKFFCSSKYLCWETALGELSYEFVFVHPSSSYEIFLVHQLTSLDIPVYWFVHPFAIH